MWLFSSATPIYFTDCYLHGSNHKLNALFSYDETMRNRPAESHFTRFSNHFMVMDIGVWHIHSGFCLVKHFKSRSSLLSFTFWPSGKCRFGHPFKWGWSGSADLNCTCWLWLCTTKGTWTHFNNKVWLYVVSKMSNYWFIVTKSLNWFSL